MKKLFNFAALCALALGVATACDKNEDEPKTETLAAPTGLVASLPSSYGATLGWGAVTGAEGYQVRINDGTPVNVTATSYTAAGLTPETTYSWDVRAVKGSTQSAWSAKGSFTTAKKPTEEPGPLAAPAGLTTADVTENSATLKWTKVAEATGYEVKVGEGEAVVLGDVDSHALTGLDAETEYSWTVRATATDREGTWAEAVKFTTEAAAVVIPLGVPTNCREENVTHESATLAWDAVPGATSYDLRIDNSNSYIVNVTGTSSHSDVWYPYGTPTPGEEMNWDVRACRGEEKGEWSDIKVFWFAEAPVVPLGVPTNRREENVTHEGATLAWDAVEGATGYDLQIDMSYEVSVTGTSATADKWYPYGTPTPGEEMTWAVRATRGEEKGEWSNMQVFWFAEAPVVPRNTLTWAGTFNSDYYWGDYYGEGTSNVELVLSEFNLPDNSAWWHGRYLVLDMIMPAIVDDGQTYYLEVPAGTYTVSDSAAKNTIMNGAVDNTSWSSSFTNDQRDGNWLITAGKVVVSRSGDNYNIAVDVTLTNSSNATMEYKGDYSGPLVIKNPYYAYSNFIADVDMGDLAGSFTYWEDAFKDGSCDGYTFTGLGDGIYVDADDYILGTGLFLQGQLSAELFSGNQIPEGTYTIMQSTDPGTALGGYIDAQNDPAGLWVYYMENSSTLGMGPIVSGTLVKSGNSMVMDGLDDAGNKFTATVLFGGSAPAPRRAAYMAPNVIKGSALLKNVSSATRSIGVAKPAVNASKAVKAAKAPAGFGKKR